MYSAYMNGNRICPVCSGNMKRYQGQKEIFFKCNDCKKMYQIIDNHHNEKEFLLREVSNGLVKV